MPSDEELAGMKLTDVIAAAERAGIRDPMESRQEYVDAIRRARARAEAAAAERSRLEFERKQVLPARARASAARAREIVRLKQEVARERARAGRAEAEVLGAQMNREQSEKVLRDEAKKAHA
eukprot:gene40427-66547_t